MGINQLNKFLRKNCPEVFVEIDLSALSYRKIAIDTSIYLCKFKIIFGKNWLREFINFLCLLRKHKIHTVFIFDNGVPPEKKEERKMRSDNRQKNKQRVQIMEESLNNYYQTGTIDSNIRNFYEKNCKNKTHSIFGKNKNKIDIKWVEYKVEKIKSQIIHFDKNDYIKLQKLFDIFQIPWYFAELESETLCSELCKNGVVDGVLSEDTDVLAYGCPIFLCKLNIKTNKIICIEYKHVLEELGIESSSFLDFCIMCGTDYNKNIYKVGPEKSFKLIQHYKNIEKIGENTSYNVDGLKYKNVRRLFNDYKKTDIENINYCGKPDYNKLQEFIFTNNIIIDIDYIKSIFVNKDIIFS
jgi:5'-3' exonuclease